MRIAFSHDSFLFNSAPAFPVFLRLTQSHYYDDRRTTQSLTGFTAVLRHLDRFRLSKMILAKTAVVLVAEPLRFLESLLFAVSAMHSDLNVQDFEVSAGLNLV